MRRLVCLNLCLRTPLYQRWGSTRKEVEAALRQRDLPTLHRTLRQAASSTNVERGIGAIVWDAVQTNLVPPTEETLTLLLSISDRHPMINAVCERWVATGIPLTRTYFHALILAQGRAGLRHELRQIPDVMERAGVEADLETYHALFRALGATSPFDEYAMLLWDRMLASGIKPDGEAYALCLLLIVGDRDDVGGEQILAGAEEIREWHDGLAAALIKVFSRKREWRDVNHLAKRAKEQARSWRVQQALIEARGRQGMLHEAATLWEEGRNTIQDPPPPDVWATMVRAYAYVDMWDRVTELLQLHREEVGRLDIQVVEALLERCLECGKVQRAGVTLKAMEVEGLRHTSQTLRWAVRYYSIKKDIDGLQWAHNTMEQEGLTSVPLYSEFCLAWYSLHQGEKSEVSWKRGLSTFSANPTVFDFPDLAAAGYNTQQASLYGISELLRRVGCARSRYYQALFWLNPGGSDVDDVLDHIKEHNGEEEWTVSLYNAMINHLAKQRKMEGIHQLYKEMVQKNIQPTLYTFTLLIVATGRVGGMDIYDFLRDMHRRWVVDSGVLSATLGVRRLAVDAWDEMLRKGMAITATGYGHLIRSRALSAKRALHELQLAGVEPNVYVYDTLLHSYQYRGDVGKMKETYQNLLKADLWPDLRFFNTYLGLLVRQHNTAEIPQTLEVMQERGIHPNTYTFEILLKQCRWDASGSVSSILEQMAIYGVPESVTTHNELLRVYSRNKDTHQMKTIYVSMVERDINTYRIVLEALGREGDLRGIERVTADMVSEGVPPDIGISETLIQAYGKAGRLEDVDAIWAGLDALGIPLRRETYHALMQAYEGAGDQRRILRVHSELRSLTFTP